MKDLACFKGQKGIQGDQNLRGIIWGSQSRQNIQTHYKIVGGRCGSRDNNGAKDIMGKRYKPILILKLKEISNIIILK